MKKEIKIGLALSGGAVKGFAHIGALKVFEKYGIKPSFIAGTSMGSLIGALYCSGMTPSQIEKEALNLKIVQFADVKVFSMLVRGLMGGKRFTGLVNKYTNSANIEDLKIPFNAVSVDLLTGKPYIFKNGNTAEAVRCSCSVPGYFEPYKKDDMLLVDGGIVNNNPYDIVRQMGADFVISVDVLGNYTPQTPTRFLINTIINSFNLLQYENEKTRPNNYDYLIKMDMPSIKMDKFKSEFIKKAIDMGEKQTKKQIKPLLKILKIE